MKMNKFIGSIAALGLLSVANVALADHHGSGEVYKKALAAEGRPDADKARDAGRKPDEVLKFLGVKPGMTVIDILAAGGYYTEVASHVVGEEGKVIYHNHDQYLAASKEEREGRFTEGRLGNVEPLTVDNDDLDFGDIEADAVLFILGFHDIYYKPENNSWPWINEGPFLDAIIAAMKPGAVLGVVDHSAPMDAPETTGNTTHRISQKIVIDRLTSRGLVLDASSDILKNAEDDLTQPMFADGIRGKTDRFVLKFKKPE